MEVYVFEVKEQSIREGGVKLSQIHRNISSTHKYIIEDFQMSLYLPTAPAHLQVYTSAAYGSLSEEPYIQLHLFQHFPDQQGATIIAFGYNKLPITGTYSELFLHHLAIRGIAA